MKKLQDIFISYRREDSAGHAGRIFDALTLTFRAEHVFIDVDSIGPGEDFVDAIDRTVAKCRVMIVVIGRSWLDARGDSGRRRLDDPRDYVRREIELALQRDLLIVPILVDAATMPRAEDLPPQIAALSQRNAWAVQTGRFRQQMRELVAFLAREDDAKRSREEALRVEAARAEAERAAESRPHSLAPHQYPIWVLFFCALVAVAAVTSVAIMPSYVSAVKALGRAERAYDGGRFADALENAETVLRHVSTSKAAKLVAAKTYLRRGRDGDERRVLAVLAGVKLDREEWEELSPLMTPELRNAFKEVPQR